MKKVLFLLLLSFLAGTTAFAADGGPYLADRHVARGMKCADCHTPATNSKPAVIWMFALLVTAITKS